MTANLKVPGVYVQEISTLPPSVAAVPTAIPAFIGYTEIAVDAIGTSLVNQPIRVASQKEYEAIFGYGPRLAVTAATLDATGGFVSATATVPYHLYDAIRLFYANGGGECFVCSVGSYASDGAMDPGAFHGTDSGLEAVSRLDEPTLLLFPDAAAMSASDLGTIQQQALLQCGNLQDRFTILDTTAAEADNNDPRGTDFRARIGINNLQYGAAYLPWLSVSLDRGVNYTLLRDIALTDATGAAITDGLSSEDYIGPAASATELRALMDRYELVATLDDAFRALMADATGDATATTAAIAALHDAGTDGNITVDAPASITAARGLLDPALTAYDTLHDDIAANEAAIRRDGVRLRQLFDAYRGGIEASYQLENNLRNLHPVYAGVANGINFMAQSTPPSGAVAGVYARVDEQRGVWKAPGNESLSRVLEPVERFTNAELAALNVHPDGGKSINAIRPFTGRGTLIFGARTLAGNSAENRYVNVRRLLIFLEESIKKAARGYVFEPNDAQTWQQVRGMIENFLDLQWRAGALQGARAKDAFRVAVGLGTTMTPDDVVSGRMIIDISIAPVRPAEFIILRFSQQQAQS